MSTERDWKFKYSLPEPMPAQVVELSAQESEQFLLQKLRDTQNNPQEALWELARFYSHQKQRDKALEYFRKVMDLQSDTEHKAACVLAMGAAMEQVRDYESAVRYYREAFALEPIHTPTWYFINNNLGFSLNTLGRFDEGEPYCRAAIEIDGRRPNAYKNLGLSLQGQGRFADAAQCFIQATRADAGDPRSLKHLEELLAEHPDLNLYEELEFCRDAVEVARNARRVAQPEVIRSGLRKHLFLLRARFAYWWKRRKRN